MATATATTTTDKAAKKQLHQTGVKAAAHFLAARGYTAIGQNIPGIDLVATDPESGALVFIEVKTRSTGKSGFPTVRVTEAKRKRLERVALDYIATTSLVDIPVRFDVISIVACAPNRAMVKHHVNALASD